MIPGSRKEIHSFGSINKSDLKDLFPPKDPSDYQEDPRDLYLEALKTWGVMAQMDMVIEEAVELIKEIQKSKRNGIINNTKGIIEESVDLEIMMEQLKLILEYYNRSYESEYQRIRSMKLNRLKDLLEDDQ